jgi:YVTN family beta-propeller protein
MMKRLLCASLQLACLAHADVLTHEQSDALAAEAARLAPANTAPVVQTLPPLPPSQYSTLGMWGDIIPWTPHIPVTCAQLPDGRLLTFASSERTTFPAGTFTYAATWDYRTGEFVEINNPRHDMFCGGVSLLPDGRLVVNGGNSNIRECSLFDWRTNTWSALPDMNDTRWYNTSVALTDGTVFTAAGSGGSDTAEQWREGIGWRRYPGINWALAHGEGGFESIWHPFLHIAPDGRIAHTGPTRTMHWVDTTGEGAFISTSAQVPGSYYPKDGAVVMFNEGKILQAGGRTTKGGASRLAYVIDINGPTPVVTQTSSLLYARTFANGVVLPNGEVMAVGGNTSQEKFNDDGSALTPEIWNPSTKRWRKAADMQVPRNYHSLAILLPDGRVWSGGGGLSGTITDHQDAQIYTPAALFNADGTPAARPEITEAPAAIGPGMTFTVRASAGIQRFTFIKLASLTHSVCSDLRFLELPFTENAPGAYAVRAHANLNVMTPGYWMLFALSPSDAFSVSKTILVDATLTHSISQPLDLTTIIGKPATLVITADGHSSASRVFTATGLPEGVEIDPSTGVISGTPSSTGFFTVRVTVDDGVIAPASTTFQWNVRSDLKVAALANPPVPAGAAFNLNAGTTGSANPEFSWNFGDDTPATDFSSSPAITKVYSAPGRYLVTLTVRDDTGSRVSTSFYQAVHAALTSSRPAVSSSIAYQERGGANARLWVVNPDQDSVTVFDAVTRRRSAIINTGKDPRTVAIAPDGRAWVVNSGSASISIISTNLTVAQTVPLPRGSRPFAIVFDPAGVNAYVSLQDGGAALKISAASPVRILSTTSVGPHVRHLSISADGTKLFATRFITPRLPGESTAEVITEQAGIKFGAEVVVVETTAMRVAKTIILEHSDDEDSSIAGRGIPNYLGPAVISPDGTSAWVPSKKDNIKRGLLRDGRQLTHDSAVRSITSRIDLGSEEEDLAARIDFNDAGIATAAAYERTGMYLFTALEGSREVAVVDSWGKRELLRFSAGRTPQGVVTSPDGRTLYVHNFMDRSVTVHDVSGIILGGEKAPALSATLNCINSEKLPAAVLKGKQLFYDARDLRLALQQYVSCASCHNDGDQDGRVWDFTGFGEGLRNNISLRGHATHGPAHWTGNFDEIQDFEGQIRGLAGGLGLMSDADFHTGARDQPLGDPKAGISADLDALAAYVNSLTTTGQSPHRNSNGTLTADAVAGRQVFRAQNCAACHGGTRFTNSALNVFRDVGTLKPSSGKRLNNTLSGLDVPTLRGLWNTAPYLHDGSAATLADAVRAHSGVLLTDAQLSQVVSFLSQIDDSITSAPEPLNVLLATAGGEVIGMFPVTGVLSEPAAGFNVSDIRISGGVISAFAVTGTSFSFNVTPQAANVSVEIPANVMTDATGLGNLASNTLNVAYSIANDPVPSVTLAQVSGDGAGSFIVNAQFSEDVTGVAEDDFIVTNGSVIALSGAGSLWSATLQSTAAGEVSVFMPADAAQDSAAQGNSASGTLTMSFTPAAYPSTFTEWMASVRGQGSGGLPGTNADGDDLPDLLEYALGGSAVSGISKGEGLRIETSSGRISATITRPQGISDLNWLLESSADLKTWNLLATTHVITDKGDGTETLRWDNLETLPGLNLSRGILRLKVAHTSAGEAVSAPVAWQQIATQIGTQTIGVNVVNPPVFAGQAQSGSGGSIYLTAASGLPGVAEPDARYYLEIRDGPNAGHHFDLSHIGDHALVIDADSSENTLVEVPAQIAGSRVAIHRQMTLSQVFDKNVLHGTNNPATADQVLFFTSGGFRSYWLLKSGSRHHWVAAGDAAVRSADDVIMPPGTGVLLKTGQPTPRTLFITGQVRTTRFAKTLPPGYSLFANPWPLDASPASLQMTGATVFTATANPSTADAIQFWKGDHQAGSSGYTGYWFFRRPNTLSVWTANGDASLRSKNDSPLFKASRAAFLNRRSASPVLWLLQAP